MRQRKAPPPNPRKISPETAELMRQWHKLGVHYRLLGEIFGVATGTAHDAVAYRNAYKRDKPEAA